MCVIGRCGLPGPDRPPGAPSPEPSPPPARASAASENRVLVLPHPTPLSCGGCYRRERTYRIFPDRLIARYSLHPTTSARFLASNLLSGATVTCRLLPSIQMYE
jgi:hypothetical protein